MRRFVAFLRWKWPVLWCALWLTLLGNASWGQSVATGSAIYNSTGAGGYSACIGCHSGATSSAAHLLASNAYSYLHTELSPGGNMYVNYGGTPALPTQSQIMSLALYIGQFKAPLFTVANGSGALAMAVRSGALASKDIYPLLANGTGGAAQDSGGLTKTNGSHGTVSVSQVGATTAMNYNASYTSTAGYTGSDSFDISVVNPIATVTRTIQVTVLGITSATSATGFKGQAYTAGSPLYQITSNDGTASNFTATGLPSGLAIDSTNGKITGTPTVTGSFSVTIGLSINGSVNDGTVSKTLTLDIAGVTSAASVNYTQNSLISTYQITTYPASPSAYSLTGTLPSGLSFNATNGQITGTPTVSGSSSVTVGATTTAGSVSQSLSIVVASAGVPVVSTSPVLSASPTISGIGTVGTAITNIQISGTNPPVTAYGVTGTLPTGVSVNASGLISGTPTQSGDFPVALTATNASGAGSLSVILRVHATSAPVINSAGTASATQGSAGTAYTITTDGTNGPITGYSLVSGTLPTGLGLNTSTGIVSGTPTVSGVFTVTLGATNSGAQTGTKSVAITVNPNAAPVISSPANGTSQVLSVGASTSIAIAASNPPITSYALTGTLPAGLSFNTATGVISGVPTAPTASTALGLTATNAAGTSSAVTIHLSVGAPAPAACTLAADEGVAATLDLKACMFPSLTPTGFAVSLQPGHGSVTVAGSSATYTPASGFSGTDTFAAIAYFTGGLQSTAGTVTVTVNRRADPSADPTVKALLNAQALAQRLAGQTQIQNFGNHLASLRDSQNRLRSGEPAPAAWRALAGSSSGFTASPAQVAEPLPDATRLPVGSQKPALPLAAGVSNIAAASGLSQSPAYQVIASAVSTQSVNLGTLSKALDEHAGTAPDVGATKVWVEGVASFGSRDASGSEKSAEFRSTGITVGVDLALSEKLTVGLGVGYARDTSVIGTDGSGSETKGQSVAVYGSYSVTPEVFVEGVVGLGSYGFDNRRYVSAASSFADSYRRGSQLFGSLGGGYEYRRQGQLISPYGRIDFSLDRLQQAVETGAGSYSLVYYDQEVSSLQGVVGVRGESTHRASFGWVVPRVRLEWRQDLQQRNDAGMAYADQIGGTRYAIAGTDSTRSALVWGVGSEFLFRDGWSLGLDYQLSRISEVESAFALRARLSKVLGAKGLGRLAVAEDTADDEDDVQVDAGVQWDDNVTRGKASSDVRPDTVYNVSVSRSRQFFLTRNTRFILGGNVGGERFQTYNGLSKLVLGLDGQYQYRTSAEFDTPTWAIFAKLQAEEYLGSMRDGYRLSAGVSYARPLTDRISVFSALAFNSRHANSAVFRTSDTSLRGNLDYAVHAGGTLYWGLEFRDGDFVSSGAQSLEGSTIARALAQDEAYPGGAVFSYRVAGQTWLTNIGYNQSLGPRDSLDISWRWVESTPSLRPAWVTSPHSYVTNQWMVNYLMRF